MLKCVLQVCEKYARLHMRGSSVIDHIIKRIMVETPKCALPTNNGK